MRSDQGNVGVFACSDIICPLRICKLNPFSREPDYNSRNKIEKLKLCKKCFLVDAGDGIVFRARFFHVYGNVLSLNFVTENVITWNTGYEVTANNEVSRVMESYEAGRRVVLTCW